MAKLDSASAPLNTSFATSMKRLLRSSTDPKRRQTQTRNLKKGKWLEPRRCAQRFTFQKGDTTWRLAGAGATVCVAATKLHDEGRVWRVAKIVLWLVCFE